MISTNTLSIKLLALLLFTFTFIACDDDEVSPEYEVPSTYSFEDKDGNSTVSFSGQTTRLNQLAELTTYMKTANTPGTALSEEQLLEMYSNNDGAGSSYFSEEANAADKQLKNKTAGGDENYQERFENLLVGLADASDETVVNEYNASNGVAGVLQSGEKAYLVDAKGNEFVQLIEKGLMGAVFYDQIQNVYLGEEKLNVDNTEAVDPDNGKYYTTMEHHFDEAFGYFTSATDFPANGTDRFWGKYSNTVNEQLGSNEAIMNAFTTGRAALSNEDYDVMDAQIEIIRTELEKVAAATGIHYLNSAISDFGDNAIRSHVLSEAVAFIEALYFTAPETAVVSGSQIDDILSSLEDEEGDYNFYEVTANDITEARDKLATAIGMEDIKTEL